MEEKISDKIVELRLATRKVCMCESEIGCTKNTLSLKSKLLYCIRDKRLTPNELMDKLVIGKTNLAIMAKGMIAQDLIKKIPLGEDHRHIQYEITDTGREYLQRRLDIIERAFKNVLTDDAQYSHAVENIDEVLELLSFL